MQSERYDEERRLQRWISGFGAGLEEALWSSLELGEGELGWVAVGWWVVGRCRSQRGVSGCRRPSVVRKVTQREVREGEPASQTHGWFDPNGQRRKYEGSRRTSEGRW